MLSFDDGRKVGQDCKSLYCTCGHWKELAISELWEQISEVMQQEEKTEKKTSGKDLKENASHSSLPQLSATVLPGPSFPAKPPFMQLSEMLQFQWWECS